jgi:hypothetical protein
VALGYLPDLFHAQAPKRVVAVAAIQCVLFGCAVFLFFRNGWSFVTTQFLILMMLFVLSIAPRYVAWASLDTAVDMVFLMYGCLILALLLVVSFAVDLVRPSKPAPLTA